MCHCVTAVCAYTSADPLSLMQNGVYTSVIPSVCTDCPLGTLHAIDDEDEHHCPHKDILGSQDEEFARSVRVRDAWPAVRSMLWTLVRVLRGAAASRPDRPTFEPGDLCDLPTSHALRSVAKQQLQRWNRVLWGSRVGACPRNEACACQVRGELASVGW